MITIESLYLGFMQLEDAAKDATSAGVEGAKGIAEHDHTGRTWAIVIILLTFAALRFLVAYFNAMREEYEVRPYNVSKPQYYALGTLITLLLGLVFGLIIYLISTL